MNKEKVIQINKLLKNLNSDSKKVSEDSLKELNEIAYEHFLKIKNITNNYNIKYFRNWSGKLKDIWFYWKEKNVLYFVCHNGLSSGCEDSDQKTVTIEELSDFNYNEFEETIKQKRITEVKKILASLESELIKYKEELIKFI